MGVLASILIFVISLVGFSQEEVTFKAVGYVTDINRDSVTIAIFSSTCRGAHTLYIRDPLNTQFGKEMWIAFEASANPCVSDNVYLLKVWEPKDDKGREVEE